MFTPEIFPSAASPGIPGIRLGVPLALRHLYLIGSLSLADLWLGGKSGRTGQLSRGLDCSVHNRYVIVRHSVQKYLATATALNRVSSFSSSLHFIRRQNIYPVIHPPCIPKTLQ